jgi:hypothetical protein
MQPVNGKNSVALIKQAINQPSQNKFSTFLLTSVQLGQGKMDVSLQNGSRHDRKLRLLDLIAPTAHAWLLRISAICPCRSIRPAAVAGAHR